MLDDTRDRVRAIRTAIRAEERRLVSRHRWLAHQDLLGLGCVLGSLTAAALVCWLYLQCGLAWWLAVPLMALPFSILHEVEHDLIHNLYFRRCRWAQNLLFFVIWYCKLGLNPWYRRGIHLRHHRASGQKIDIEERLIGIGLPFGFLRLVVSLHPFGAVFLLARIRRDVPEFRPGWMTLLSLPTYVPLLLIGVLFLGYAWVMSGVLAVVNPFVYLPAEGWSLVRNLTVLLVLPNMLRQTCLVFMSSYSHYYDDMPSDSIFYQNQILRSWLVWPFQLFCFNFGATHIVHHYVVNQPFYLRHMVARAAHVEMLRQGTRLNDLGTVARASRWGPPPTALSASVPAACDRSAA